MTSLGNAATSLGGAATSRVASGVTSATSMATSAASRHHGLTCGQIAGIVVGSVVGGLLILGLLMLGCFCLWRKKRKAKKEQQYMTEKNQSIDSTPSTNTADVERGRANGASTTAPATNNKKPNEHDASHYMSSTSGTIDETAMKNTITPAHMAGIRTADDVAGTRGTVMDHTMQTAKNIGDYPVNDVSRGKTVETAGECKHYGVANP